MLSTEAQQLVDSYRSLQERRSSMTLEALREGQRKRVPALPEDVTKEVFFLGDVEVEKLSLPNSEKDSALVYIHGGGFQNGFAHNGYHVCVELARKTNQTIYAMNYRLAPEFTYPTGMLDCLKVWKHLVWKEGIDVGKSTWIGTSAGASLVLSVALWSRDHGIPLPSSLIVNSPFVGNDIEPSEEEIREEMILNYKKGERYSYFQTADDDDPCAYPILGDYYGFPPTAVYYAKKEILAEHSRKLAEKLISQGVETTVVEEPELWHAFLNANVPENRKHYAALAQFIQSAFSAGNVLN